jgi:hypothetical protein
VKALISYYTSKFCFVLLAPIYYHFGHISLVIDILSIGHDLVDILGTYFLNFIFVGALIFYRNFFFQIFNKYFFKNYFTNANRLPLFNYFSLFFASLKKKFRLNSKFKKFKKK